jgi:hypothetical protein
MPPQLPAGGVDLFFTTDRRGFAPFMHSTLLDYNDEGTLYKLRSGTQFQDAYPTMNNGDLFELILRDINDHENPFVIRKKRTKETLPYFTFHHPYPRAVLPNVMLDPEKFVTGRTYTVSLAFNGGMLEGTLANVEKQPDSRYHQDMFKLHFRNARVLKNGIYKPYLLLTENEGEQHFNIQNYETNSYGQQSKNYYSVVKDYHDNGETKFIALLGGFPISNERREAEEKHEAIVDSMKHYLVGKERTLRDRHDKRRRSSPMDEEPNKLGMQIGSLPSGPARLIAEYALPRSFEGYGGAKRRSSKRTRQKRRHGRRRTYSRR